VPPPGATEVHPADPCPDPDKLGYTGFVAHDAAAAVAVWESGAHDGGAAAWDGAPSAD
jgi:hypothetical protein